MIQYLKASAAALLLCGTLTLGANAQIETPQPSPLGTVTQKIGLTDVTVTYSRPSMKGRKVFGGVVPYGKPWRTGANQATKISFRDDIMIEGQRVPAGEYAMYTIPGEAEWTVVFNRDTKVGGDVTAYKKEQDAARVTTKPISTGMNTETFTIAFMDVTNKSANLTMMWENTAVKVNIATDYDAKVMASIDEALKGTDVKPGTYYTAARYYHENNKDKQKALQWINKATEKDPQFWMLHTRALIQADNGDYNAAIASANQSIELARKAGNEEYVKMNEAKIAEWAPKAKAQPAAKPAKKKK